MQSITTSFYSTFWQNIVLIILTTFFRCKISFLVMFSFFFASKMASSLRLYRILKFLVFAFYF
jgi:hypothetical protein